MFELDTPLTQLSREGELASNLGHEGPARAGSSDGVRLEVEEYDCGCTIRFRLIGYGEAGDELPRKPLVVPDYIPCSKHKDTRDIPPRDARLTAALRREHENFLTGRVPGTFHHGRFWRVDLTLLLSKLGPGPANRKTS